MSKWDEIRRQFKLRSGVAHFDTMVVASHPEPVAKQVADERDGFDTVGPPHFFANAGDRRQAAMQKLFEYFDVEVGLGALTHSTTVGLAQVLGGIRLSNRQEFLASRNEHAATMDTLRLRADRDGWPYRQLALFRDSRRVTEDEILQNIGAELRPWTRVLALTWVYSSDGVKLPIARIAKLVERENRSRVREEERLIFVVDGVHGFGIEDTTFKKLGCDFFVAGCHKSLFGPRGTGIIAGRRECWPLVVPWVAPLSGIHEGPASRHVPGGVRAFDHWWALGQAFAYHLDVLKKEDVELRVHTLTRRFKEGLSALPRVTLVTPAGDGLSSGIMCVDVEDREPGDVIADLEREDIMASESSWDATAGRTHVRFAVSILNTEKEVDKAVRLLGRC